MADEEENEKLVRAFYEATAPGHRESLRGLQAPHVIYDLPEGMPMGCGHFEGLQDVLERFLTSFMELFTFASLPKSSLPQVTKLSRWVVSEEKLEKPACLLMCPSPTSGPSVKGISNDCVHSPTQQC
jgi:hypothetical protein